ncbi:MAG TPA: hypothetical protein VFI34_12275 [Candidatus Limnocylindrales bacterium]|nr:hypothetical protein [Candidatus Limnocylindrales bacterium]
MSLAVLVVTLAQALDLGTFVRMIERHGAASEANPLIASILADHGLPVVAVAKMAGLALVVAAIVTLTGRRDQPAHPRLAAIVAAVAIVAGLVGGWTNAGAFLA